MKKCLLFLNGDPPDGDTLDNIANDKRAGIYGDIFCTDGAYCYLSQYLMPDVLIADFDTLSREEVDSEKVEIITFGTEKDYTDGFLAIKIIAERGYNDVDIYGAYGGRPDMAESNYFLLVYALSKGVKARFCGKMQTYLCTDSFNKSLPKGSTVSVVPFSDELHILYTKGLKYALAGYTMKKIDGVDSSDYIMGVSNESIEDRVEIAFGSGYALVFVKENGGTEKCG